MKMIRFSNLVVLLFLLLFSPTNAQEQPPTDESTRQRVGFIDDSSLGTASPNDPGPDGISRFANIVSSLGFEPVTLDFERPIPEDIRVLILIRPQNRLSLRQSAILYQYLIEGNALLLAADPNRYFNVNSESERDMLTLIFENDYGVRLRDNFLMEPWFTVDSLEVQDLAVSQFLAYPENTPSHPITAPITGYDLPISTWASRSVDVEPFGLDSFGNALIYTNTAYGETATRIFGNNAQDSIEYNIGEDPIGRLPIAGIGVNTANRSRIMLFGDSELFQNGFGLNFNSLTELPDNPGNFLLAERTAAWLLGLPVVSWPGIPEGFTWIAIDGTGNDWEAFDELTGDDNAPLEQGNANDDLQSVQGLFNTHYLYLLAHTAEGIAAEAQLRINFSLPDGNTITMLGNTEGLFVQQEDTTLTAVPDGAYAANAVIEARIPLRLVTQTPTVASVCIVYPNGSEDCLDTPLNLTQTETVEPAPLRIHNTPLATVRTSGTVNLRSGPNTNTDIVDTLTNNTQLSVLGRNNGADWVFVQTGGYQGWLNRSLVFLNTEIESLSVIEN